ncbi:hypothetical protein [Variovorax sp. GT1P44]|uniref:hypothetical protein n=1 Tax=Variovorax sp. GT1P44 TaxID=3443742 RepID=UPI003F45C4D7
MKKPAEKSAEKVPPSKASSKASKASEASKSEHHALLDPSELSGMAEEAASDLMAEGESG